jgi:hypothetical protein
MHAFANKALATLTWSPLISAAAIIALIIAVGFLWSSWQERRELRLMASLATSNAADIARLAPGTLAEVAGTLRCVAPLTGEFSRQPCAYFKAEIIKRETWYEKDSDGKNRQQSRDTTLHSSIQHAPCEIEDASGRVALDLSGATIDETEAINETIEGKTAGVGSLVGAVTGVGLGDTSTYRKESNLAIDIPVYVVGEVRADGSIGPPAEGSRNNTFLISRKSKEERSRHLASMSTFGFKLAGASAAISVLLYGWAWYTTP